MTKLLEIETALLRLDPAGLQRLGEAYLYKRGYQHPHQIGVVLGSAKTRTGTPDTLLPEADGRYVFAEYTTIGTGLEAKLAGDIGKCQDENSVLFPIPGSPKRTRHRGAPSADSSLWAMALMSATSSTKNPWSFTGSG